MKGKKQQKAAKQTKNGKAAAPKTTKAGKPTAEPKHTIKHLVIETLAANTSAPNAEMIAAVKKEFPKSAFKDTHAAWYRSQARKGLLTGRPIVIPAMSRKLSTTAS